MDNWTISSAVKYICNELSTELSRVYADNNEHALVGRLQETDGTASPKVINKTVISLINTEHTAVQGRSPVSVAGGSRSAVIRSAPLHLNLFLLVAASYTDYAEALKNISICAAFFQSRKDISTGSRHTLPDNISKLDMQLENLSLHELSNVWGMLGGKHYPCLYYKVRMVTLDSDFIIRENATISNPGVEVGT